MSDVVVRKFGKFKADKESRKDVCVVTAGVLHAGLDFVKQAQIGSSGSSSYSSSRIDAAIGKKLPAGKSGMSTKFNAMGHKITKRKHTDDHADDDHDDDGN